MEEKVPNWDIGPGTCKQIRMASGFANLKLVFRAVEAPNWDLHPVSKLETCSLWAKKIQIGICVREQLSRPAAQGAGFAIYSEASFLPQIGIPTRGSPSCQNRVFCHNNTSPHYNLR